MIDARIEENLLFECCCSVHLNFTPIVFLFYQQKITGEKTKKAVWFCV